MSDFTARMVELSRMAGDPEFAHGEADDLMVSMLRMFGYDVAMDAYESMTRWYA